MRKYKIANAVATAASIFTVAYVVISFIQVNACNLNGGEVAAWNFFQLFVRGI